MNAAMEADERGQRNISASEIIRPRIQNPVYHPRRSAPEQSVGIPKDLLINATNEVTVPRAFLEALLARTTLSDGARPPEAESSTTVLESPPAKSKREKASLPS